MSVLIAKTPEDMANLMHVVALKQRLDAAADPVTMFLNILRDSGYHSNRKEILSINNTAMYTRGSPHPGVLLAVDFNYIEDGAEFDSAFFIHFDASGKMIGNY
jgi:hypothetical protein